ncbi:MAG: twitching motility protein PilT [Candidatus Methanoplasma sp.]|jgi:rRNA-processing protein FCF1|nr:twitching motility protein PilT [Candidatus Methanoplasma sp.]
MQIVVLDTNALLMPFEININLDLALRGLLGDVKCVVPGPLIGELKHLDHKFSKAALELARRYDILQTAADGDDAVIEAAAMTGGYILTNDRDLRTRARSLRIPLIYLRSGNHLVAESVR